LKTVAGAEVTRIEVRVERRAARGQRRTQ
jgi:hypothetical protein